MRRVTFILALLVISGFHVLAQEDPTEKIIKAVQQSDSKTLAGFFNETVDLGLPENDNSYSASQGEMVMRDFFRKYPPLSFEAVQNGATDADSRFTIGTYKTGSREFKVYIHLKKEKSGYRIHKIKFEE